MKLYDVTKDLEDFLDEAEPDDDFFADTMESLKVTWDAKAGGVSSYIGNLEAMTKAIKTAEKEMADRRKAITKKVDWLKGYLIQNMERVGIDKIETSHFVVKIKKNPPKVVINNEEEIPEEFWEKQVKWVISKSKIKNALKGDESVNVNGAEIIQERRLEIK